MHVATGAAPDASKWANAKIVVQPNAMLVVSSLRMQFVHIAVVRIFIATIVKRQLELWNVKFVSLPHIAWVKMWSLTFTNVTLVDFLSAKKVLLAWFNTCAQPSGRLFTMFKIQMNTSYHGKKEKTLVCTCGIRNNLSHLEDTSLCVVWIANTVRWTLH
jgi:hypothetical protein